ncbi:MAG: ribonuclease HIII [Aquificaceae bacterium]
MNVSVSVPQEYFSSLYNTLKEKGFKDRYIKHTLWSLQLADIYIALYPSGSLLLQGKDASKLNELKKFILSFVVPPSRPQIGCDESGKGDVFGPIVFCCAAVEPKVYKDILGLTPKDCKLIRDDELFRKVKLLSNMVDVTCILYEPKELNSMYEQIKNMNRIMDMAYESLLEEVKKKYPECDIYIDAYSKVNPFDEKVHFEPKGERVVFVAVASMFARAKFIEWLKRYNLPKGSTREALLKAKEILKKDPKGASTIIKTFFLE